MGMFDSLISEKGAEWQTKAFDCNLDEYAIGDQISADGPHSFQVEVIGDVDGEFPWSLATIRDGLLESVGDRRDHRLPLLGYGGVLLEDGDSA